MNNKEEIIQALTNTGVLNSDFDVTPNYYDYKFCINYFKKWCNFLGYKISYESFYYFLLEYDKEGISIVNKYNTKVLVFNSGVAVNIINLIYFVWYVDGLKVRIEDSEFYKLL